MHARFPGIQGQLFGIFASQRSRIPVTQAGGAAKPLINVRVVQRVGDNGPVIPRIVDFNWPEQKMKMTMRIENPQFITLTPDKVQMRFNRQNLHYQSFDLYTQKLDGAGVQQAGATGTIYRR